MKHQSNIHKILNNFNKQQKFGFKNMQNKLVNKKLIKKFKKLNKLGLINSQQKMPY